MGLEIEGISTGGGKFTGNTFQRQDGSPSSESEIASSFLWGQELLISFPCPVDTPPPSLGGSDSIPFANFLFPDFDLLFGRESVLSWLLIFCVCIALLVN